MKWQVKIPNWIDGLPLFVQDIEAPDKDAAIRFAVDRLRPIFERYNQPVPPELYQVATAKQEEK